MQTQRLTIKSNQQIGSLQEGEPMIDIWCLAENFKRCSLGLPHWGHVHYPWILGAVQRHHQLHFNKHHPARCASYIHDELCCMFWYLHTAVHCLRFSYGPSFSCIIYAPSQIKSRRNLFRTQCKSVRYRLRYDRKRESKTENNFCT